MRDDLSNALKMGGDFLDEIGLDFLLGAGTLLGAIREGGLIDWDFDVDVRVLAEDLTDEIYEKITKHPNFMGEGNSKHFDRCHQAIKFNKVRFDIFPLYLVKNKRVMNACGDNCLVWQAKLFNKDKWEKVTMLDREWNVPGNPEKFLEYQYGKNWRTPIKNWHWQKHSSNFVTWDEI